MTTLPWLAPLAGLLLGLAFGAVVMHARWLQRHRHALRAEREAAEGRQRQALDELAQACQQRQADEARFRAFVAALPDATLVLDVDGRVADANPTAQRLLRWVADTAPCAPADVLRIADPTHALSWNERLRRAVRDPFADSGCLELRTVDGQGNPLILELWPWRTQLRGQDGMVLICRDLSTAMQARASAAALHEQLAQDRQSHAKALSLQQARAQAAVRAKDEFLANMSHELRTPLNVVLGQAHLASQCATGAQVRQMARLSDAAQQLLGLLNDVLEFAQRDNDEGPAPAQDTDLSRLLWQLGQGWSNLAEQKGLELVTWLDANVPAVVQLDEWRIRRVLNNLLGNALKFTTQGHITLRISHGVRPDGQPTLRFEVSDTGIGIPPEVIQRLGKPFEQVDSSSTRAAGGAGLGLAICRRLLDRIGASLSAASRPGHGARFWFDVALTPGATVLPAWATTDTQGRQRHALVVEALDDARAAQAAHLIRLGYAVQAVATAAEAQLAVGHAEAVGQAFDLCLIDAGLGDADFDEMSADELARRIRAVARRRPPQLVQMSRAVTEGRADRAADPFVAVCRKPSTPATLADALAPLLGPDSAAQAPAPEDTPAATAAVTPESRLWADVAGLDPQIGMRIVRGDPVKFERLLRRFVQSHRDDPDHLRAQAARGQTQEAKERAHMLKGTAGAIGAHAVSEAAARVCQLDADAPVEGQRTSIAALATSLNALLDALIPALDEAPAASVEPSPEPDPESATQRQALCEQLWPRLEQRDMSALRFARENESRIRALLGTAAPPLLLAIQTFDYDHALSLLGRDMPSAAPGSAQVAAQT